ncbi:uncharacterized protein [Rutidosis leptorrhynchoides]|uniref:uncharacterized protein n=1 Tax=Rutidosis leptorrhynchoides TaxID=125765 RepID=UPI003A9986EB
MGRRHLLYLLYTSSVRPPSSTAYFTSLPPPPPFIIHKGYSHESSNASHTDETIIHERAPSTLEEFKRIEEEKEEFKRPVEEKARQGVTSQTSEKARDGFVEEVVGDDHIESVKESFKEPVGVGNKTGHK